MRTTTNHRKAALLGGFAIFLVAIGTAPTARASPAVARPPEAGSAGHMALLLPVRHHRHHGYWRHWSDRYAPYPSPETEPPTTAPETTPPPSDRAPYSGSARPVVPPTQPQPSRDTTSRSTRGSGSSRPAIRWVDPDKPVR
jgi:hypothetical protein